MKGKIWSRAQAKPKQGRPWERDDCPSIHPVHLLELKGSSQSYPRPFRVIKGQSRCVRIAESPEKSYCLLRPHTSRSREQKRAASRLDGHDTPWCHLTADWSIITILGCQRPEFCRPPTIPAILGSRRPAPSVGALATCGEPRLSGVCR